MKSTGVVRKIDDLGRIVIPKEIRRNLRIRDGESLEFYVDDNSIILKKFSVLGNMIEYAKSIVESLYSITKKCVIVTDTNSIISVSSNVRHDIFNEQIGDDLSNFIKKRECVIEKYNKKLFLTNDFFIDSRYVINPIIVDGDCVGLIVLYGDHDVTNDDLRSVMIASKILSKSIED